MRLAPLCLLLLAAPLQAAPASVLSGRVFQRGSIAPLPGAQVRASTGQSAVADEEGRFHLELPPGEVELHIQADRYEPLRVREQIQPGRRLEVEFRLVPSLSFRAPFTATVRGDPRRDSDRFTLRDEELRTLPGTLGDPLRAVSLLPGVSVPVPVLPIYVVRGASPGMNGYFLDGMRVPQLFHLLLLSSFVYPGLVGRIDFYPGAYDASFGRFAGGIIDAETRPARSDGSHGELQVRLFDVAGAAELKLPRGVRLTASGQYGYPGPLLRAFDPRVDLQYWDYQLRLDWKGLTVQALGFFDYVNITREEVRRGSLRRVPTEFRLMFHRVQVRHHHRIGRLETEAGLVGGVDELSAFGGNGVRKLSLAFRANGHLQLGRFRLLAGVEGELSRFTPENFGSDEMQAAPDELADFGEGRTGIVAGAFAQGSLDLLPERLSLTAGGRIDVYHAGRVTLLGLEPRAQLRLHAQRWLAFTLGGGLYQQPPSFPVPLPGIDTFALQLGLQRAVHGASGLEMRLPQFFYVKATGFYQKFMNMNDVVLDFGPQLCTSPPPESLRGAPALVTRQVEGQSFGMEVMVRRKGERINGWVSYTLSRAERIFTCGLRPADYDQTHVLNVVLQVRLPWRILAGARLSYATGRPVTQFEPPDGRSTVRNNGRLPDYVQLDLRLDREWRFQRWALAVFVEVVNATYSQVNFGLVYPEEEVTLPDGRMAVVPRFDRPELNGFPWVLPSVGLRAHF